MGKPESNLSSADARVIDECKCGAFLTAWDRCDCDLGETCEGCCSMKTIKPFDPTKPVQMRDGRKARIICTDFKGTNPIVVLIPGFPNTDREYTGYRKADGSYPYGVGESPHDLVNVVERTSKFSNVYKNMTSATVDSREKVDDLARMVGPHMERIAILEYLFEDGELVDVVLHKVA